MDNLGRGCACNNITEIAPQNNEALYPAPLQSTDVSDPCNIRVELIKFKPRWDEPKAECGEVTSIIACPEHKDDIKLISHRCFNPACPECCNAWISREVRQVVKRLRQAENLYRIEGLNIGEPKHVTISPPQDYARELMKTKEGYKKLRTEANKMLKKLCCLGGTLTPHAWRFKKDTRKWELEPHFHSICYGFLMDSDLFEKETGWVYKNISAVNKKKNPGYVMDIGNTMAYILDHCTLFYEELHKRRTFDTVTMFGILSNNKLKIKERYRLEETVKCKAVVEGNNSGSLECGKEFHKYTGWEIIENEMVLDGLIDEGIYTQIEEIVKYEIVRDSCFYRWDSKEKKRTKARFKLKRQSKLF